jgi:hypothetical protein
MSLRHQFTGRSHGLEVLRGRVEQLRQVQVRRLVANPVGQVCIGREIDHGAPERDIFQHAARRIALPRPVQQGQHGAAVDSAEPGLGGVPGRDLVALVDIDEQVLQQAVLLDLLDVDGQALGSLNEAALLDQHGGQVGADGEGLGAGLTLAPWLQHRGDQQGDQGGDHRQPDRRSDRRPARHARGEDRRQFLLALQPGEGDQGPDEHADRHDDRQQLRHRQQGQLDHHPQALAALDDDLQLIQALAQNADSGQRGARADDGTRDLPEKIALDQGHAGKIARCRRRRGRASNTHPTAPVKPRALILVDTITGCVMPGGSSK